MASLRRQIRSEAISQEYSLVRPRKKILFEDFAREFLEIYSKQNKKSWKRDEFSLQNLISFFKNRCLSDITPDLIEKYKAKRREKVSPSTVNRELACLKTVYSKAIEWEKTESNPVKKVKFYKEDNVKERILEPGEMKKLLDAAAPHLKAVLIIALNTGMRRNEMLGLKWKNINFARGYIFIEDSKSGRSRKVPMNSIVSDMLKSMDKTKKFVFSNPHTKRPLKNISTSFKSACEKSGIKDLRLHDLRHTAATRMIEAGIDLVTVSKILGHSSIQMTMRYAHPTPENMQRAVESLAEALYKPVKKVVNLSEQVNNNIPANHLFLYN
jgi:integrase